MGYRLHPTVSDKPMNELSADEILHETKVRVMYEAHIRVLDPTCPEPEALFGQMVLVVMNELPDNEYERLMEDAMEYARFKAEQFAASQGKTLDEVLDEAGFGGENNTDWFKGLDTQFNA